MAAASGQGIVGVLQADIRKKLQDFRLTASYSLLAHLLLFHPNFLG